MNLAFMWVDAGVPVGRAVTGIRGALPDAARLLLRHGFDSIEIMLGDPAHFEPELVRSVAGENGVGVTQLCTGEYFGSYGICLNHIDPLVRRTAREWGERTVALSEQLGCPMNIGRFRGGLWEDGRANSMERMAEGLSYLDGLAASRGVTILIEPLREAICDTLNTVEAAAAFIAECGLSATALMLDTDHTSIAEEPAIRNHAPAIEVVHLSDSAHQPLGKGTIPFDRFFALLREIGYDGPLSVEVFPDAEDEELVASSAAYIGRYLTRSSPDRGWRWK